MSLIKQIKIDGLVGMIYAVGLMLRPLASDNQPYAAPASPPPPPPVPKSFEEKVIKVILTSRIKINVNMIGKNICTLSIDSVRIY